MRWTGKSAVAAVGSVVLLGILIAAPSALGQAAVDQYVPAPGPDGTTAGPGGTPGGTGVGAAGSPVAQSGAKDGAGEPKSAKATKAKREQPTVVSKPTSDGTGGGVGLPGDGYPVTPFVLIAVALLACLAG